MLKFMSIHLLMAANYYLNYSPGNLYFPNLTFTISSISSTVISGVKFPEKVPDAAIFKAKPVTVV